MSVRNLEHMFRPQSIAVFGASRRERSVGGTVMRNLLAGGFSGPVLPVNPKYESVAGVLAYRDVAALPLTPDLAVICTPPETVPGLVSQLGERGTKAAIVLTAGLSTGPDGLQQAMLDSARPHLMRILGPNCIGLLVPQLGVNASFAHTSGLPGKLAFVTQSGALATTVLDWAKTQGIGFSHFVSLGNSADVDFGDVLDYLGSESGIRAILLYIESIKQARKFMSAARAAARNKPVIVVKAGRMAEGAKAAASHTGALTGSDEVYDAAIARAGMLRVDAIEDLFAAVETLGRARPLHGERLAILTNGGGPGVLATDLLVAGGGRLAELSQATLEKLNGALPPTWSKSNPLDIIGDAPGERYVETLKILVADRGVDAVLFIHAPTAIVPSLEVAEAVVPVATEVRPPLLGCWLGGSVVAEARRSFAAAGIPSYDTPEDAVGAFLQMVHYRRNQDMLMETPPSVPQDFAPKTDEAKKIIDSALAVGREILSEPEAKAVLTAYGIPVVETLTADSVEEAVKVGERLGFPVALKILSPQITHKSDVGGVALDLNTPAELEAAARTMADRVSLLRPDAEIEGFTVQRMARRPQAQELIIGASEDPIFGPVLLFGQGGTAVEIIADRALALPPLNLSLARDLVSRTRVSRLLEGYRDRPAADVDAILLSLVKVAQLIGDLADVVELDINPLLADESGVVALDARIRVKRASAPGPERLAIRPYPGELEEDLDLNGWKMRLRPIRPEDEPQHRELFAHLSSEDIRFRFFGVIRAPAHSELARFTQIDYDREMAFVASFTDREDHPETLGVARAVSDPDNFEAEFAIVVRSDLKGKGLGRALLEKLIRYCRSRGTGYLVGEVLPENKRMLALAERLGFERQRSEADEVVRVRLALAGSASDSPA